MQTNKQTYIDFIVNELNKGNVQYKDVCSVFCSKFQLSERTFNSYWKNANVAFSEQREAINKKKLEESITQEKEAVKSLVLDKYARMKIAEGIALGKARRIEGQIVMPSDAERLKALDYLSKIEGDYAPTKTANTDSSGNDVDSPLDTLIKKGGKIVING